MSDLSGFGRLQIQLRNIVYPDYRVCLETERSPSSSFHVWTVVIIRWDLSDNYRYTPSLHGHVYEPVRHEPDANIYYERR
jgi:hypothetical protein